jgi:catechol 2,3-dioxygenase-like lactoylglutathione lyase family enzyme
MKLTGVNHLAFITNDLTKTIRFWRDLLGLRLEAGIGHEGYRHYFFKLGEANQIAFFEYEEAAPMAYKFHGERSSAPLGFDHLSMSVDTVEELFACKDRLEAAGVKVHGAVDHGIIWSIYFFDPNNIPLEISWETMAVTNPPAMDAARSLGGSHQPHPARALHRPWRQRLHHARNLHPRGHRRVEAGVRRVDARTDTRHGRGGVRTAWRQLPVPLPPPRCPGAGTWLPVPVGLVIMALIRLEKSGGSRWRCAGMR